MILDFLLPLVVFGVVLLASFDGMRFVFRGTRDYLHAQGSALLAARIAGALAALSALLSGAAVIISIIGWVSGHGMVRSTAYGTGREKAKDENA